MANAFAQPTNDLNAFVPSQSTAQMLAPQTGTMYDPIIQVLGGISQQNRERAAFDAKKQAEADKLAALEQFNAVNAEKSGFGADYGKVAAQAGQLVAPPKIVKPKDPKDLSKVSTDFTLEGNPVTVLIDRKGNPQTFNQQTRQWELNPNVVPKQTGGNDININTGASGKLYSEHKKKGFVVSNLVNDINKAVALPSEAYTNVGSAVTLYSKATQELKALKDVFGFDVDKTVNSVKGMSDLNVEAKARVKELVRDYAAAKGETPAKFSDKDAKAYAEIVVGSWGNPREMKKNLLRLSAKTSSRFFKEYEFDYKNGLVPIPPEDFMKGLGIGEVYAEYKNPSKGTDQVAAKTNKKQTPVKVNGVWTMTK